MRATPEGLPLRRDAADRPVRATYRLQLGPEFRFVDAQARIPYLRDLGVSHLYLSPSLQARPGSTHGYDVIDPTRLSDDLGGEQGFRALAAAAHEAGLGIVLDLVPNHMAADDANPFWADPALRAKFFDVDRVTGLHRRFFDIDDLAGVRMEDPDVFATTHALVLGLVAEGVIDGLRIDHPDGLADPTGYLQWLRERGVPYVWVEKILAPEEPLRGSWPVDGTTGYDFLNDVIGLFVDPAAERELTSAYGELTGERRPFDEIAHAAKLELATGTFGAEVDWLRRLWAQAPPDLEAALCSLPVYRTYLRGHAVHPDDRAILARSSLEWLAEAPEEFIARFQQTTPPITAKGVEDTAFYRYGRFLALNDVGGDPGRFGISVEAFHATNAARAAHWPRAMLTLQTHDTKRSADVRARLVALSWHAEEFLQLARTVLADDVPPDMAEGWFFLQTVLGAPVSADRLRAYVEKALRERKLTSSWSDANKQHEQAMAAWTVRLLDRGDVRRFADRLSEPGRRIATAQKLLQLTSPGVPDIYEGDEDELLALVDPDNRRPVDWSSLRTDQPSDKLALTRAALTLDLVERPYTPLPATDAVAYTRGADVLVAAPVRARPSTLPLPAGRWRDAVSDEHEEGSLVLDRPRLLRRERAGRR